MFNLRLALRTLLKTPFVTVVAALSLALGIGANTAIYSIFDQMLRRPLPVYQPERLANLSAPGPTQGSNSCNNAGECDEVFSYPMLKDLQKSRQSAFSGIVGHRLSDGNIAYKGLTPMNGQIMFVTGSYFPVLGLQPALGRLIGPSDDETLGAHPLVVLAYDYWQTKLGGDRSVLNQTMIVNGQQMTIIGVAPEGFEGTTLGSRPNLFVPMTMRPALRMGSIKGMQNRQNYWVYLFARLKPGVSMDQAKSAINAIYHPIINDVEAPLQKGMSDQTMKKFRAKEILLKDASKPGSGRFTIASTLVRDLLFLIVSEAFYFSSRSSA